MIRITVGQRTNPGDPRHILADVTAAPSRPTVLRAAEAAESDVLSFRFFAAVTPPPAIRILVGNVVVASTLRTDRVTLIDYEDSDAGSPPLGCRGRFLADWVGLTELVIEVRSHDAADWEMVLSLPLAVSAGKLKMEQFDQLFAELERDAGAVLLDVHGKTQLGLKAGSPLASEAPVAVLNRIRETVGEVDQLFHRMARQPASRLRLTRAREQALLGQAVSETTLIEACDDPGMLCRAGRRLAFREHVHERSQIDYRIPEHQVIADFAEYLRTQLAGLRQRIDAEIAERIERRRWRSHAREPGKPTWWETEDLPRIEELQRCRQEVVRLNTAVGNWRSLPFLPPGRMLRQQPQSTPLFRNHGIYRRVFRAIAGHFLHYQATLDTQPLLTRARSLPVLYEWWCAVQVIRILSRGLTPRAHDVLDRPIISTRLAQEGKRFTVEFTWDQAISFEDSRGCRVRFRYQPQYTLTRGPSGPIVGVLGAAALRTPDMAIEVFRARPASAEIPDLIIILDAKYSSETQEEKMIEVMTKYSRIGDGRTGRVLSRQVWALTPAAPAKGTGREELRHYCTVDNDAFWSPQFDANNPVTGAVQTRPVRPGAFDPLQALLEALLRLAGVDYGGKAACGRPQSAEEKALLPVG
jgi:hypothetical protein